MHTTLPGRTWVIMERWECVHRMNGCGNEERGRWAAVTPHPAAWCWLQRIKYISRISKSDLESGLQTAAKGLSLMANFIWSSWETAHTHTHTRRDTHTHTLTDDCSVSQLPVSLTSSVSQPWTTFSASCIRACSQLAWFLEFSLKTKMIFLNGLQNKTITDFLIVSDSLCTLSETLRWRATRLNLSSLCAPPGCIRLNTFSMAACSRPWSIVARLCTDFHGGKCNISFINIWTCGDVLFPGINLNI